MSFLRADLNLLRWPCAWRTHLSHAFMTGPRMPSSTRPAFAYRLRSRCRFNTAALLLPLAGFGAGLGFGADDMDLGFEPGVMPKWLKSIRGLRCDVWDELRQISKCRCGPVTLPVAPMSPMRSPCLTFWPALTLILFRWP